MRWAKDAEKVQTEVIKQLQAIKGANVVLTLEVEGNFPDGIAADLLMPISENCKTLRMDYGFEES